MAYQERLCALFLVLLVPTSVYMKSYGERCSLMLKICEYKGGACDIATNTCGCFLESDVFSIKTGQCQTETPVGSDCTQTADCTNPGAVCTAGVCTCDTGYYASHYEWLPDVKCLPVGELGETCTTPSGCDYENAVCINSVCDCVKGFKRDNTTDSCVQDTTPPSVCAPSKCTDGENGECCCDKGMYRSGDECRKGSETAVIGLKSFSETTLLTLSWYPPAVSDPVHCYDVSWRRYDLENIHRMDTDNGSLTIQADMFQGAVNISGLVPGNPYTIRVGSKLKCDDENDVSRVFKMAIMKPQPPGPISSKSDLDPGQDGITIEWEAPSVGVYTDFTMKMLSLTKSYGAFYSYRENLKEPKAEFYTKNYGLEMNVTLQACTSIPGSKMCSDEFKTIVTTLIKAPSPARDVRCIVTDPGQIEVTWDPPRYANGNIKKVDVYVVPVVDAMVRRLDNSSGQALDNVKHVAMSTWTGGKRSATFNKLPKTEMYTVFVYAYNQKLRSVLPGSQDIYGIYTDKHYKYGGRKELKTLNEEYSYFMVHLEDMFYDVDSGNVPPVCFPVNALKRRPLKRPKRLSVTKLSKGSISLSWRPPKAGILAGYVAKVTDKRGTCYIQYEFRCVKGCLTELLEHPQFKELEKQDLIKEFPEPDNTCANHVTVNMTRDEFYPSTTFVVTGLPKKGKKMVKMTSVGYFRDGQTVTKKARKAKVQCDVCKSPRDLEELNASACNDSVTGALFFTRGYLEDIPSYPEKKLQSNGASRLLYRSRKNGPKSNYRLLPGTKTKKCACGLLKEEPHYKLALLKTDPTGKFFITAAIYSLEESELESLYERLRKTCWRR